MTSDWTSDGPLAMAIAEQNDRVLDVYRADPSRLEQDANIERSVSEGAYAKRQLWELLQNSADAMRDERGRCEVVLTAKCLYVANTGLPLSTEGVMALMATHKSIKRGEQIGRFGLGFKSVLAVCDTPRIFSRSGSIAFDRVWAQKTLEHEFPGRSHYPVTRLARSADPVIARADDKVLDEMMKWATTVVQLPVTRHLDVLTNSMRIFPAEFLLFSRHVAELTLRCDGADISRRATLAEGDDDLMLLNNAGARSSWVIASKRHAPSRTALTDGGYQAARETVEITWAAPVEGARVGVGAFWAYFPTSSLTSLSGIVNAPWKLADDRESLLPGPFNDELLTEVLPSLVVSALPRIFRPGRPAAVIDVLPARGKEIRSHADDQVNQPVMNAVGAVASVPTLAGTLERPSRLRLHPDKIETDELELWRSVCPDPERWVDHSITSNERRSKVQRLLTQHNRGAVTTKEWLEHIAKGGTVEGSAIAVRLLGKILARRPDTLPELVTARVLLLENGSVHACRPGQVFLPGGAPDARKLIIDPRLGGFVEVRKSLDGLGIKVLDEAGALRSELTATPLKWENIWVSSRRTSVDEAEVIFREVLGQSLVTGLRVRVRSGLWKAPGGAYLPGPIVPGDGSRDPGFVVDDRYHQQDVELMRRLGVAASPRAMSNPPSEPWRIGMEFQLRDSFRRHRQRPKLADESIHIEWPRGLWPLGPLSELSPEGRAALVADSLDKLDTGSRCTISSSGSGTMVSDDPTWRFLKRNGFLPTEIGLQPIERCLAYDEDAAVVNGVRQPLPFVTAPLDNDINQALGLRADPQDISPENWAVLVDQAAGWVDDRRALLYAWAAFCKQPAPSTIRVERGRGQVKVPPQEVAVTSSPEVRRSLAFADCPVLFLDSEEDAATLRDQWGLVAGESLLDETLEPDFTGEPFRAADKYPPLRASLPPEWQDVMIQPCARLDLLTSTPTGQKARPLDERLVDRTVLTTAMTDRDVLLAVGRALSIPVRPDAVLRRMEEQHHDENRLRIAETRDLNEKLVLAIGADALRASIPEAALTALSAQMDQELDDSEIARLALSVDGYAVLQAHTTELQRNRLDPPAQWAGSRAARDWVRRLNFPPAFAGVPGDRRDAETEVEGPSVLGELHEYQQVIAGRIRDLLDPSAEATRGLVPLPTGAGKTRVAVQALVEHMVASPSARVVWIAETDELCEQAARTWSDVWRAKGGPGLRMTISRLWAGNEANERDGVQVVVASVDKLAIVIDRGDPAWEGSYSWLTHPTMIVVDEAHRSIGPQYRKVLSKLGGASRVADMTTPLLGLTATPFRGWNETETEVLASRYHRNKLDIGVFPGEDVYGYLQDMGVLARVRQIALDGATLTLTDAELKDAEGWRRVPDTIEQRLGRDDVRNNTIVRSIRDLPAEAKALVFATSVENARVLAAMLTYHGVQARAVSGKTENAARRRFVEEFRSGSVRVLTNYNVFTEGFDVPSVDAVYITRPTFSPNVYQQMIGRGLRGPLNGGKSEVLVVNVDDNLTNFGEVFAFRHFEHLWAGR